MAPPTSETSSFRPVTNGCSDNGINSIKDEESCADVFGGIAPKFEPTQQLETDAALETELLTNPELIKEVWSLLR